MITTQPKSPKIAQNSLWETIMASSYKTSSRAISQSSRMSTPSKVLQIKGHGIPFFIQTMVKW